MSTAADPVLSKLVLSIADRFNSLDMLVLAEDPDAILKCLHNSSLAGHPVGLVASEVAVNPSLLDDHRWSLVCVIEPEIDTVSLTRLLARLRDLHSDRVIHFDNCQSWSLADSLALGFIRAEESLQNISSAGVQVFEFDIRTYKSAPDWLNAKHWANPEHWGKYRW